NGPPHPRDPGHLLPSGARDGAAIFGVAHAAGRTCPGRGKRRSRAGEVGRSATDPDPHLGPRGSAATTHCAVMDSGSRWNVAAEALVRPMKDGSGAWPSGWRTGSIPMWHGCTPAAAEFSVDDHSRKLLAWLLYGRAKLLSSL